MAQEVRVFRKASAARSMTLADVIRRIDRDKTLRARHRRNLTSALRTLCRQLGAKPRAVSAQPQILRHHFEAIPEGAEGRSRSRWTVIRCQTFAALKRAGVPVMGGPGRSV